MYLVGMCSSWNKDGVALGACQQIRETQVADTQFFAVAPPGVQCDVFLFVYGRAEGYTTMLFTFTLNVEVDNRLFLL